MYSKHIYRYKDKKIIGGNRMKKLKICPLVLLLFFAIFLGCFGPTTVMKAAGEQTESTDTSKADETTECRFYLKKGEVVPLEDGNKHYPDSNYTFVGMGSIYKANKITGDLEAVSANIASTPDMTAHIPEGKKVVWYVVKKESNGWHCDGIITDVTNTVIANGNGGFDVVKDHSTDKLYTSCGDDATCLLGADGTLSIFGTGKVTSFPWKEMADEVKQVVVAEGITGFNERAFAGCTNLTNATYASGVTSVGGYAFDGCTSLESVTLPSKMKSLPNYVFRKCTSLVEISLPDTVTKISECNFHSCSSLERIIINSKTPVTVQSNTFSYCSATVYCYRDSGLTTDNCGKKKVVYMDEAVNCRFYLRKNNERPKEDGNTHYDDDDYIPVGKGKIYVAKPIFDSVEAVEANIESTPDMTSYVPKGKKVVWYVIKKESNGWHCDGVLIDKDESAVPDGEGGVIIISNKLHYDMNADGDDVKFNESGYEIKDGIYTDPTNYEDGDTVTILSSVPIRKGYLFCGWSEDPKAAKAESLYGYKADKDAIATNTTYTYPTGEKAVTLYAIWTEDVEGPTYPLVLGIICVGIVVGTYTITRKRKHVN